MTGLRLTSNTGITGARTFTITYELTGLVSQANDVQTFTLPLPAAAGSSPSSTMRFYGLHAEGIHGLAGLLKAAIRAMRSRL